MTVEEAKLFWKTLYLGDRACQGYSLDSSQRELRIQVDLISRNRGAEWGFNTDEDIANGLLTFAGVKSAHFSSGSLPNDYIEMISVQELGNLLLFRLELGSVDDDALTTPVTLDVVAAEFYLESPDRPGLKIR